MLYVNLNIDRLGQVNRSPSVGFSLLWGHIDRVFCRQTTNSLCPWFELTESHMSMVYMVKKKNKQTHKHRENEAKKVSTLVAAEHK